MAVNENRGINANGLSHIMQWITNLFVKKENGKGLSSNDYTLDEKVKLAGVDTGANKTVVSDSLSNPSTTDALSAHQGKVLNERIDSINTSIQGAGKGDMRSADWDTNSNGQVDKADDADKLGGVDASEYVKQTDLENLAPGEHNHDQSDINGLEGTITTLTEIANGKSMSKVFDTAEAMNAWLSDSENTKNLKAGDVFLIRAADVPDYWWDGSSAQVLETTKVTIEFLTNDEIDEIIGLATN